MPPNVTDHCLSGHFGWVLVWIPPSSRVLPFVFRGLP